MRNPDQLVLPSFEGRQYPDCAVRFAGGIEGDLGSGDVLLSDLSRLRIGESFRVVVMGEVASKRYALKHNAEGDEHVLTLTLKIDGCAFEPDDAEIAETWDTALEAMHSTADAS